MTTPSEVCTCDCDPHRWWCRDYRAVDLPYGADTEVIEFNNGPNILAAPGQSAALRRLIEQNTRNLRAPGQTDSTGGAA